MKTINLSEIVQELEKLFDLFNDRLFDSELTRPIITVSPDTTKGAHGWCTTDQPWRMAANNENGFYEINMCPESLNRSMCQICATLVHEMCHLSNLSMGITDCSRGGYYHNKAFKIEAEKRGLIVEKTKYGFSNTKLGNELEQFVNALDGEKFKIYRKRKDSKSKAAKSSNSIKHVCPRCNGIARTTKDHPLICGLCEIQMIAKK